LTLSNAEVPPATGGVSAAPSSSSGSAPSTTSAAHQASASTSSAAAAAGSQDTGGTAAENGASGGSASDGKSGDSAGGAKAPVSAAAIAASTAGPAGSASTGGTPAGTAAASVDGAAAPPSVTPTPAAYPTTLARLPETVKLTIQMQTSTGSNVARISLSPPQLGGIRVQLQQTSAGIVARVTAEHSTAAHVLEQSSSELRKALEGAGVHLLRLDIGQSGTQSKDTGDGSAGANVAGGSAAPDGSAQTDAADQVSHTVTLSNGALVDILA
jgi:flagellar hook-length control protein FliK